MSARSLACGLVTVGAAALLGACSSSPTDEAAGPDGPTVLLSVLPAGGAVDISLTTDITVGFSRTISDNLRHFVALHDGDCPGPVVSGTWTRTSDGMGLGFIPFGPLIPGTEYTIHVGGGMTDGFSQPFDLRLHGIPLGGETATEEMVLGPDGMGMGVDMMGATITHTGLGWAHSDGTYGMVFQFTTGG